MTGVISLPTSLAANDEAVVLVGSGPNGAAVAYRSPDGVDREQGADDDPWPPYSTVWVSTDDGTNWDEHKVWSDSKANGFRISDAASAEFGLILARSQEPVGERAANFMHYSEDGISWEACWTTPLAFDALVPWGDAMAAYESESGDIFVWNEPQPPASARHRAVHFGPRAALGNGGPETTSSPLRSGQTPHFSASQPGERWRFRH